MRKKLTALILGGIIAGSLLVPLAGCIGNPGKEDETVIPEWENNATLTENGVEIKWKEVENATEYRIYHSQSRFGDYKFEIAQTECEFVSFDKYGYYRVDAMNGEEVISSEIYSYELDTFGKNTHIYSPYDNQELVQADVDRFKNNTSQFAWKEIYEPVYEQNEDGEWVETGERLLGEGRYAGLFKKGKYNDLNLQMRYYMTFSGLDYLPTGVELGGFYTKGELSGGNSTCNFWCGIDNMTVNSDVQWSVSQATSFRRMKVNGNLTLHDTGKTPWASGGFISDTVVSGNIDGSIQQQWFTRNSSWNKWSGCDINMVYSGCTGGFADKTYAWPERRVTVLETTNVMREKPYLVFDDGYYVCRPALQRNSSGVSWSENGESLNDYDEYISLDKFYVARSDRDNAKTINAALNNGKHILFTAGIYDIESPLLVTKPDTIVMGLGLATLKLAGNNKDTIMSVSDVDGVQLSGIMFDAGEYSQNLLRLGDKKTQVRHNENPTVLNDVYYRIGVADKGATSVDLTLEINSNDVVGDNFWVWRADHGNSGTVGWDINKTKNGVIVNGDYVTIYGLMVEHFHEYQTIWKGEHGFMAFYQSETPYDVPSRLADGATEENPEYAQDEWMSEWNGKTYQGYASYKVADGVKNHTAYGIGVYYVASSRLKNIFTLDHAIELPSNEGIHVEHMAIANFLNFGDKKTNGGIRYIVNERGKSNFDGAKTQFTSFIAGKYVER